MVVIVTFMTSLTCSTTKQSRSLCHNRSCQLNLPSRFPSYSTGLLRSICSLRLRPCDGYCHHIRILHRYCDFIIFGYNIALWVHRDWSQQRRTGPLNIVHYPSWPVCEVQELNTPALNGLVNIKVLATFDAVNWNIVLTLEESWPIEDLNSR